MKWFKHFSMAHADDKIVSIRSNFGMWGVGAYWTLIERAAEQMKATNPEPTATILVPELCSFLGCKRNKLISFLNHLQNIQGMNHKLNQDVLIITVPKLLEIKDNYQKDLEVSTKKLPSIEVEVEVERDIEVHKEKNVAKRPQSVEDIINYMREIGCNPPEIEGASFWDYFSSNGWKVGGRSPMKDWKAAARNWKRRKDENGLTGKTGYKRHGAGGETTELDAAASAKRVIEKRLREQSTQDSDNL